MRTRGNSGRKLPEAARILPDGLEPVGPSAGVYLLLDGAGTCIYVGQSVNVAKRVREHQHARVVFDRSMMLPAPDTRARLMLEAQLIQRLRPDLNTYAGNAAAVQKAEWLSLSPEARQGKLLEALARAFG